MVQRIRLNQAFTEAMQAFDRFPTPNLRQFGLVLAASQETTPTVFQDTLELLRLEVERSRDLYNLSRQSLTLIRSTARVLQMVLAAALIFVSIFENWRVYFVASPSSMLMFFIALGAGALGSLYIEAEIHQLEF